MADGQLDHVVTAPQGDHVVVDSWPGELVVVLEMELLGLKVLLVEGIRGQRQRGYYVILLVNHGCKGKIGQNIFLLPFGKVPKYHDTVGEDEHFGESIRVRGDCVSRGTGRPR